MYRKILKNKNFRKMVFADVINRFGDSVDAIAFTWLTYDLSKSAAMSALVFAMNILPTALFQPILGPVAERCKKKPILILTDFVRGAMVLAVVLLLLTGTLRPWMLLVFTFAMNTVEALRVPCGTSFLVKLISEEEYDRCISFSKTACTAAQLAGTAAGGFLVAWKVSGAFFADALTFVISAVLISGIVFQEEIRREGEATLKRKLVQYRQDLTGGLRYMAGSKPFLLLILAAVLFNLESTFLNSLMAPYAAELFSGGGEVLSVLSFTLTSGMLIAMYFYPKISEKMSYKMQLLVPFLVFAAYYFSLLVLPALGAWRYVLLAVFTFGNGLTAGIFSNLLNVLFVKVVDQDYMVRATGVFNSAVTVAMPVISFLIAAIVKRVSLLTIFGFAGALGLICALFFTFWKVTDALPENL